jgi:hypothetical protein
MERAAELAALSRYHPERVEETRIKAEGLLDQLRPKLPPDVYAAAVARGQARDLAATIGELLDELTEGIETEGDTDA